MKRLSPQQILFIHTRLTSNNSGTVAVRDLEYLESACERPFVEFNGIEIFPDIFTKAAGLLHALIDYHPFVIGNQRVALASTILFLKINGYEFRISPQDALHLTTGVVSGELDVAATAQVLEMSSTTW